MTDTTSKILGTFLIPVSMTLIYYWMSPIVGSGKAAEMIFFSFSWAFIILAVITVLIVLLSKKEKSIVKQEGELK